MMRKIAEVSQDTLRARVFSYEQVAAEKPQVALHTAHHFANGIYARELHIPKGVALTGAIHKFENMNILSKGDISVLMEDGWHRMQAPCVIVSPPGTKRVAYVHEDCIWTTLFATTETDPEKIVDQFTTNSDQEYLAFRASLQIEGK